MPWTDSHGRPEILMHPDIVRGVASYRVEPTPEQSTPEKSHPAKARSSKPRITKAN